jgi:hypothetical protein
MEQKRFEVEITFRQTVRYTVDAKDRKVAEQMAVDRWRDGDEGKTLGSDCCEVVAVLAAETPSEDRQCRDCDTAFRYLRDRELVIELLDDDAFNPTVHDAVSAEDVAIHVGWKRKDDGTPDVARAARALDRLCNEHRVVCFTRPRVRARERGEVRLYCTPQHLERLSGLLMDETAAA